MAAIMNQVGLGKDEPEAATDAMSTVALDRTKPAPPLSPIRSAPNSCSSPAT